MRERLAADGLLRREGDRYRTTRKWQAAMARAALRLYGVNDRRSDLRVPITVALMDIYGATLPDAELADAVEAMLRIEAAELDPRSHLDPR